MAIPERDPDLESYSLEQLYDIRDHLDAHAYPERAAIVERLIADKEAAGERVPLPPDPPQVLLIILALLGVAVTAAVWYYQGLNDAMVTALLFLLGVGTWLVILGYFDRESG